MAAPNKERRTQMVAILLRRGKSRGAGKKSLIASFELQQRFLGWQRIYLNQPSRMGALRRVRTTGWSVMMTVVPGVSVS